MGRWTAFFAFLVECAAYYTPHVYVSFLEQVLQVCEIEDLIFQSNNV